MTVSQKKKASKTPPKFHEKKPMRAQRDLRGPALLVPRVSAAAFAVSLLFVLLLLLLLMLSVLLLLLLLIHMLLVGAICVCAAFPVVCAAAFCCFCCWLCAGLCNCFLGRRPLKNRPLPQNVCTALLFFVLFLSLFAAA